MMEYHNDSLYWSGVDIASIAQKYGTPFFLYNRDVIENNMGELKEAFSKKPVLICYACKANSNVYLMRRLADLGLGLDIVSGGELFTGLFAGFPPEKIVFSGVGKTEEEIEKSISTGILSINVESEEEFELIVAKSKEMNVPAQISIRINPGVNPETHPYISTGTRYNKFGISLEKARGLMERAHREESLKLIGIHTHIGSQVSSKDAVANAAGMLRELYLSLKEKNIQIHYLNMGGGLPVDYENDKHKLLTPSEWAEIICKNLGDLDCTIIVEPGRRIMAKGGILITRVLYRKETSSKKFIVVDSGNNDFIRPSLYGAHHRIIPLQRKNRRTIKAEVVGPICESSDFFARDIEIQDVKSGELLAILDTGAYGFVLSSNYNSRLKLPEVIIENGTVKLIRKRETYESLLLNQVSTNE